MSVISQQQPSPKRDPALRDALRAAPSWIDPGAEDAATGEASPIVELSFRRAYRTTDRNSRSTNARRVPFRSLHTRRRLGLSYIDAPDESGVYGEF